MKGLTKEMQIALVAIVGVVILFFGLQFLKGLSFFTTEDTYYVEFDNTSGLTSSSAILANGYKIGSVSGIEFDYGSGKNTIVTVKINNKMQIPQGTVAEIESDMLGNTTINLNLGDDVTARLMPGDTLSGSKKSGMLGKVGEMVPQIEKMMPKLDSIMGSLNALLADPALAHSLHNVEGITANLTRTTSELNTLMATVNKDLPELMSHTTTTMANAEKMTTNMAEIDFASTMQKVDATLHNVRLMTQSINNRHGSLGLLMHDPGLYNNLTSTMASADSLLRDLKAHPKRYVHFSLFGKKEK